MVSSGKINFFLTPAPVVYFANFPQLLLYFPVAVKLCKRVDDGYPTRWPLFFRIPVHPDKGLEDDGLQYRAGLGLHKITVGDDEVGELSFFEAAFFPVLQNWNVLPRWSYHEGFVRGSARFRFESPDRASPSRLCVRRRRRRF